MNQGLTLARCKAFDDALYCLNKALEYSPEDTKILNTKALALQQLGKFEEALVCYENVLTLDPKNVNALNDKGQVCHRMGKFEEALACYDASLSEKADVFETWYNKTLAQAQLARYREAIKSLTIALKINPSHTQAQELLNILRARAPGKS